MNQITSQLLEACSRSRSKEASISAVNAIKNQKPNTTLEIHSDKNRKLLQTRAPEKDKRAPASLSKRSRGSVQPWQTGVEPPRGGGVLPPGRQGAPAGTGPIRAK